MSELTNIINSIPKLYKSSACSVEQIRAAESKLGFTFCNEYTEYLESYGAISFHGTELTGLNVDDYNDVVSVTLSEREKNDGFPNGYIVIENIGIEGLLILQDGDGIIYDFRNGKKERAFDSLSNYIASKVSTENKHNNNGQI